MVAIIPAVAILPAFQKFPKDAPRDERFSWRILSDLALRCCALPVDWLTLYVAKENTKAQTCYTNFGFAMVGDKPNDNHILMAFELCTIRPGTTAAQP